MFKRASSALSNILEDLENQRLEKASDTKALVRELKGALQIAMMERERLETERAKECGIVNGGYAIDFASAQHEIGRRLACLRAAGSTGQLPE